MSHSHSLLVLLMELVLLIQLPLTNCFFPPLGRTGFNALGSVGSLMATKYEYRIVLSQYLSHSSVGLSRVSVV